MTKLNFRVLLSPIVMAGVVGTVASRSCAADGMWIRTGANTPETAYAWNAAANWQDGVVPNDSASVADFESKADASSVRFVRLPDALSLKSIKYGPASGKLRLIGDGLIDIYDEGLNKSGTIVDHMRIYSDVRVMSGQTLIQFKDAELCGDLLLSVPIICLGSGPFSHRLDLYAKQAGGERISPMGEDVSLSHSYGELRVRCPESSPTNNISRWTLVANSRIARRVGDAGHALPAGALVSASNGALPDGCFLKRIYDRDLIELSEEATVGGEIDLTFGALSCRYEQAFKDLGSQGSNAKLTVMLSKHSVTDTARLTLNSIDRPSASTGINESKSAVFDSETAYPGTVVLVRSSFAQPVILKNCHLEFAGAGFENAAYVRQDSAASCSRLTVESGMSATIACLSNVIGRVVKDGAGVLSVAMPHSQTDAGKLINSGTISVEAGTLRILANDDGAEASVKNLEIGANGEVCLADGAALSVESLSAESGAVVSGKGAIRLSAAQDVSMIILKDGARIETSIGAKSSSHVVTSVVAGVVGKPAFWVDASRASTMEIEVTEGTRHVKVWHDCREKVEDFSSPRYMFATNVADFSPTVIKNANGEDYAVDFAHHQAGIGEVEKTEALIWSEPVSNIKAVFKVLDPSTGGGTCVLGATSRLPGYTEVMRRTQKGSVDGSSHILNAGARARKCVNFLNGSQVTRWSNPEPGYPIQSYTYNGNAFTRSVLHEIWNTNGVDLAADVFGYSGYTGNANGIDRICECIVYTNDLTYAERLQVAEYLTQKWCGGEATYDRFGGVNGRIDALSGGCDYHVGADEYVAVDEIAGSGVFTKTGAGSMYVDALSAPSLSLNVSEGAMTIRSVSVTRESLPPGAYLHLDASDEATLTCTDGGVSEWRDWRGADYPKATAKFAAPALKSVAELGGKNVVDFGDFHEYDSSTKVDGKGMQFATLAETRSVFFVYGSARGGGSLIGGSAEHYDLAGLFRGKASGADPASPLIGSEVLVPRYIRLSATSSRDFGGTRFRRDGTDYRTGEDGFGGKYEVISLVTPDAFTSGALSLNHYDNYSGGQDIGEAIIYERALSEENVKLIEAYLRNKWFGDPFPCGYRPAHVASIDVADGATVSVCGNAPLTVGALAGAGTIDGVVSLGDGTMSVTVAEDGSIPMLTVGDIDLTGAATVNFGGAVNKLAIGDHVLISSASIKAGASVAWTVSGLRRRSCSLVAIDGALIAKVMPKGSVVVLR